MSSWDRQAALDKYNALFDEAGDEAALIKMLGSPTHLAISLANSYVPTPAPAPSATPEEKPESPFAEFESAPQTGEAAEDSPAAEPVPAPESAPEVLPGETEEAEEPGRRVRPFGLIVSILFGLVIGLPVAIVLICIGIPFLALGAATVGLSVSLVLELIGLLAMFSDVLIVVGAGLVLAAVGLLLAWFGLWLSISLGQLWIGGAVLKACRAMSWKEVAG